MLEELHVRDLALIEEAWLTFGSGMTVLSGETGAGKTVLLGALKLLLGERADSSMVRAGATEALVEGSFVTAEGEVLVRRRVGADGRSRCAIDGEMAPVGALMERIGPLVDLHGQHEHQALLSRSSHVGYLDRWASGAVDESRAAYVRAHAEYAQAVRELEDVRRRIAEATRDVDHLRFIVDEIDKVAPEAGEDEELEARLPTLMHAERLSAAANEAVMLVRGEGAALDSVAGAHDVLGRVAGIDPALDELASRLAEVTELIDDIGAALRRYRDGVDHDPVALDALQARLAALTGLKRRYGPTLDDVLARRSEAAAALETADSGQEAYARARARVDDSRLVLEQAGAALDVARRTAAPGFSSALEAQTRGLAMDGARFEIAFTELPFEAWTEEGPHTVEFLYSPAPGVPARPLARIASGGELSRVMLALKCALGSADTVETLVFDEVDAGIGGATATAIGARLAALAQSHQVIVVTHLAQVAAFADAHLVVRKVETSGSVATTVVPVEGESRIDELARMLSGGVSEASRTHAAELLARARDARTPV